MLCHSLVRPVPQSTVFALFAFTANTKLSCVAGSNQPFAKNNGQILTLNKCFQIYLHHIAIMNTISITTSQNIEVEYELGSVGDRILGYIIDLLILAAYIIILLVILNLTNVMDNNGWVVFIFFLPVIFYSLLCETLLDGQSVGKKVMRIKVLSLSGEQASFGQYLLRWLFRIVDFSIFSGLVAVITVAATDKKQRVGDLVAGTIVIKTTPRTAFTQTMYVPTVIPDYHVTYPQVVNLKDSDIQLVKEVIITVQRSGNTMLALQAQQKIEQVLHISSKSPEPIVFLHTVLADYNYITSTM